MDLHKTQLFLVIKRNLMFSVKKNIAEKLCHSNQIKTFLSSSNSIFIHISTATLPPPFVFATFYGRILLHITHF